MRLQYAVPISARFGLKRLAHILYRLSDKVFQGPFNIYDLQTFSVLRRYLNPDSNCIDVGANVGHILTEMIRVAPRGHHMAFEPIPILFKQLKSRHGNKVELFNCALSDCNGVSEFHYYKDSPALSGFRERAKLGQHDIVPLEVKTMRLDDVCPSDRRIDLIKIDVEGAELAVLKGAIKTLSRNRPMVLFEAGLGGADEYDAAPGDFFDLFADCGLSLSLMEYLLRGKAPFDKSEFCGQFYKHYNYFFVAYDPARIYR